MIEVWDDQGNRFEIIGGKDNILYLRNNAGAIHDVAARDLCKNYKGYPPDVGEAFRKLQEMLVSGEITIDDIRKIKEAL